MTIKSFNHQFLRAGIVLLLLAIVAIIVLTINTSHKINDTAKGVAHTQEVLLQSEKVVTFLLENETGGRGYIITGNKIFLEPFEKSQKEIYKAQARLKVLTSNNPEQRIRIDSVAYYLNKKLAFSKSTISTYNLKSAAAAIAMVETGEGKFYTDRIRFFVNNVQQTANALLEKRQLANYNTARRLNNMLIVLTVAVLLLVIILLILAGFELVILNKNKEALKRQVDNKTNELSSIFERITDAFVALDSNWCYTYMNKKAGEIFQRNPVDIIGKNIWTEFPEAIDQSFYEAYHRAIAEQQYIQVEENYSPYNKWFENHIYPSPDGLSIFFRDITDKKLSEEKIIFEQLNKMALINSTDDFIWSVSHDLKLIAANTSFLKNIETVTGIILKSGDELLLKVFPQEFLNVWQSYYNRALLGESFREETYSNYSTDKSATWIETAFNPIYLNQDIIGIACYSRNITERKKAEEQVKESEEKFRTLVQQAADGIVIVDEDGNYLEANESMAKITGYSVNELKTMNGSDIVEAEDLRKNPLKIDEIKTGKPVFAERVIVKKDGTLRDIEISAKSMQNGRVICILRDATERKKTQEKIRLSEIRLLKAEQIGKFGYWQQDLKSDTVWASKEAMRIYGFGTEEGELQRATIAACIIDVDKVKEAFVNLLQYGKEYNKEIRINPADGSPMKYISTLAELEKNEKGEPVRIVGTLQDITERKKAEKALKESEAKFRSVVENIHEGLIIENREGNLIYANPEFYKMFGYLPGDENLLTLKDYIAPSSHNEVIERHNNRMKGIEVANNFEYKGLRKDGTEIWVEARVSSVIENNKILFTQSLERDITERKKAEETLKEKNKFIESIINASPSIIYIHDIEERKNVYINDGIKANLGYTDVEILEMGNQVLPTLMHPEDFETYLTDTFPKYSAIKDKEIITHEFRMKNKSGNWKWFYCTESVFLRKPNGIPKEIFGIVTDITERKETEDEIKKYNERFQVIARTTNDALWEWNFETGELWANQTHQHLYDVDVSDPVPTEKAWEQKIHPADRERVIATKNNAYESDTKLWISEYRFETKNGFIDIYDRCYIIRNADGKVIRATGTMMDITERKKAEEKLRLSESRTRRIFESDMIGFIYFDLNGEILDANDRFLEMTGYSKQDLQENKINWSKMTPTEYHELDRISIVQIVNTGTCQPYEKEYLRKDGSRLSILIGATALEGDHFGKGISYVMDITERIKAERKLKENETYLRTILDTEPECVKILNLKGELVSMNPAGLSMIEADNEQQVLGHQMTELVLEKYRNGFNDLSKNVFKGNQGTFEFEITGLKGGHRWLETHAVPLKDASGEIKGLLGVTQDVTDRKKAETEIENTTHQLRQLTAHLQTIREEERKRIAREIHDELGQQLTAIKMDTVWINKQIPAESVSIKNKLQNMIELLDGSHQSVRKILNELRPAALDDNGLLETLEWLGKQFSDTSNTPVHFTCNQSTIKLPQETAICIFRVYQEALTNIMRYAGASKVVSSLNITDERIVLTIQDNGKGFNTAGVQNKNSFGLLGIKERVHSLNGAFALISLPEKGTTIVVNLPYTNTLPE